MRWGWAENFVAVFSPGDRMAELLADLREEYHQIAGRHGPGFARRWYVGQILRSLPPLLSQRLRVLVFGRRAGSGGVQSSMDAAEPWIGGIFQVFAMSWLVWIFWTLASVRSRSKPQILQLSDGTTFKLYATDEISGTATGWVQRMDAQLQQIQWHNPLDEFLLVGLGPPVAILFGILMWLALSELFERLGRFISVRRVFGR